MAEPAEVDNSLFGDTDGDVGFGNGTGWTDISDGGDELYTTHWAENGDIARAFDFHLREVELVGM